MAVRTDESQPWSRPVAAAESPSSSDSDATPPRPLASSGASVASPSPRRSPSPGRAVLLRELRRLAAEETAARAAIKSAQHVAVAAILFPPAPPSVGRS